MSKTNVESNVFSRFQSVSRRHSLRKPRGMTRATNNENLRALNVLRANAYEAYIAKMRGALERHVFMGLAAESLGVDLVQFGRMLNRIYEADPNGQAWAGPHTVEGSLRQTAGRTASKVKQGRAKADDGTRERRRVLLALLQGWRVARPAELMPVPALVAMAQHVTGSAAEDVIAALEGLENVKLLTGSQPVHLTNVHRPTAPDLAPRDENGAPLLRAMML